MNRGQALTLYICHFLSTWNARSYEFAAILFTAAAFPEGLRAASFVGIANSLAAILFGSYVGRWIDHGRSRLRTLITTILINKAAVITACAIWLLIVQEASPDPADDREAEIQADMQPSVLNGKPKLAAFAVLLGLGLIESLSRKANLICIERDWVPILAPPGVVHGYTLTHVNAVMGRIDMGCKMVAPIAVSQFLALISPKVAAIFVAIVNILSLGLEYLTTKQLWNASNSLRIEKSIEKPVDEQYLRDTIHDHVEQPWARQPLVTIISAISLYVDSLKLFFSTEVWAPTLAYCITHGSILSVTGVTVVFFLDSGYSLQLVTIAETASAFFELSSTFVTPYAVKMISQTRDGDSVEEVPLTGARGAEETDENNEGAEDPSPESARSNPAVDFAITHTGLYGFLLMVFILVFTFPGLFYLTSHIAYPIPRSETKHDSPTFHSYPVTTILILACLAISRLGRGVLLLCTQQLAQSRVSPEQRSSFAGVEMGFVSLLGLAHNLGTAVLSEPSEFGVLAVGSWVSLVCSAILYIWWMSRQKMGFAWWKESKEGRYQPLERIE